MTRKECDKEFLECIGKGKQIWIIKKVKELPSEIVFMAKNLANLDFINYVRITDDSIAASSENHERRPKVPINQMNHATATGVEILYSFEHKTIDFFDINSPIKGNGSKMVDAVFKDFPKDWHPCVLMDWSDGFWDNMKEKYKQFDWLG